MQDFFDRKTFDPVNNLEHQKVLNILRAYGASRHVPSRAFEMAANAGAATGVFVDLGCGDSRDWLLAKNKGFTVHRIVGRILWKDGTKERAVSFLITWWLDFDDITV